MRCREACSVVRAKQAMFCRREAKRRGDCAAAPRPKRSAPKGNERGHTLSSHPRASSITTTPPISQRPHATLAYRSQGPSNAGFSSPRSGPERSEGPSGSVAVPRWRAPDVTLTSSGRGGAQRRRDHHRLYRRRLRRALRPRTRDDVAAFGDRQQTTSEWSVRRPRAIECTTGMLNERSTARSAYNRSPLSVWSGLWTTGL